MLVLLPELAEVTIDELATKVAAPRTTVWRIVKQLGYPNYHSFSHELTQAVRKFPLYNRVDMDHATDDPEVIRQKFIRRCQQAETNLQRVNLSYISSVVDMLYAAETVNFYNCSDMYIKNLQLNLSITGKESNIFWLKPDMLKSAAQANEHTLTFVKILDFPEIMDITDVFDLLKVRGSKIILLANDLATRYDEYIDSSMVLQSGFINTDANVLDETILMGLVNELYRGRYVK